MASAQQKIIQGLAKQMGKTAIDTASLEPAIAKGQEAQDLESQYLESLKKQTANLGGLAGQLQQAYETGKSNLQSQASQALAGSRLARGGRGLASSRATAISSGRALGEMESQSKLAQSEAQQEFLKASTAQLGEEKKIKELQAQRAVQAQEAVALVNTIIDEESGVFVTTQDDINRMKDRFKAEVLSKYANNPEALKQAIAQFNAKLGAGKTTELFGTTESADLSMTGLAE